MASFRTSIFTDWNTSNGVKTAVIAAVPGDCLIAFVGHTGITTGHVVTDNAGGTWVQVLAIAGPTAADSVSCWIRTTRVVVGANITVTTTPGTTSGGGICVIATSGMTRYGLAAVRSFGSQATIAAATPAPILSKTPLLTSPVLGFIFNLSNPAALAPRSSPVYSERHDLGYNAPVSGAEVMSLDSGETSATITWGGASATAFSSIAVELDATDPSVWAQFPKLSLRRDAFIGIGGPPILVQQQSQEQAEKTIFVEVAQAEEADTAAAIAAQKTTALGQASETDTAQDITERKLVQVAQAPETDSAGVVTPKRTWTLAQASETDTAQEVRPAHSYAIPQATETDSAGVITPKRSEAVAQASETDTAQAVGHSRTHTLTQALETDSAQTITPVEFHPVAEASEADTAGAVSWAPKHRLIAGTSEADTAQSVTPAHVVTVGQAVETDTAGTVSPAEAHAVGQSAETDSAGAVTPRRSRSIAQGSETDTAQAVGHSKAVQVGQASETDTAQTVAPEGATPVDQVVETDSAGAVTPKRTQAVAGTVEADTAGQVTPRRTQAIGQALETDQANGVTTGGIVVGVGQALETDTASQLGRVISVLRAIEIDTAQAILAVFAGGPVRGPTDIDPDPSANDLTFQGPNQSSVSSGANSVEVL